ncbi:MAG: metal-dependent transcriptional regulator [Lentisphaeria bacterium]
MEQQLTESLEDYLEAIAELIAVEGHAHSKEIAKKLDVKMPSVTGALRQLEQMKYIIYNTHYPVQLTKEGEKIARIVIHRHHVLKNFFAHILGAPLDKASNIACHLEHIVDKKIISRFIILSKAIENRTDAKGLQTYLTEAISFLNKNDSSSYCVLSELRIGENAEVVKFGRNLTDPTTYNITIGKILTLERISLDKTSLQITIDKESLDFPLTFAENLWVKRLSPEIKATKSDSTNS